jgi:hypothetical protein
LGRPNRKSDCPILPKRICHEDPNHRIGRHRDPRNFRGRKDQRTKEVRVQPNNSLSRNPVAQINASYCRFEHGENDPDHRIRFQLVRDCRDHEGNESE